MSVGEGLTALRMSHQILRSLSTGPSTRVEIQRALGMDVIGAVPKALDAQLQRMRVAGLIETHSKAGGGTWQLRAGIEVCPECAGKGVIKKIDAATK